MRSFLAWLGEVTALPAQVALLVLVGVFAVSRAGISLSDVQGFFS